MNLRARWKIGIIAISVIAILASTAFAQYFTINKFHSEITIHEDSSFIVKEKIDVTFQRPRHGIYRDIPFKYTDELGKIITTPTRVLSVTDSSGKEWNYEVSKTGHVINIRIGDAKKYVKGHRVYVITYQVENAILFFEDHDELYWNVTGNDWKVSIREASADVHLDIENKSKKLWAAGYTGLLGTRESECSFETYDNGSRFVATRALKPREGLTIAFGWDKGLVHPPPSWKKLLWAIDLEKNWVFLIPLFTLICMINIWYWRGRDPRARESIRVMYEPPKFDNVPLIPAEVGTLVDERLESRDITSTIVGLAVKGYMKIEETEREGSKSGSKDFRLKMLKKPDANLSPFETKLMGSLNLDCFPWVFVSDLKNRFYLHLDSLKETIYGDLVRKGYFPRSPEQVRNLYLGVGFAIIIFGGLTLALLSPDSILKGILAGVIAGLPVIAFSRVMPAKTRLGASAFMDVLGFQEFLNRAEKDKLERMGDKDLFSKFLPYAIALNVADNWAKAFEGIYQDPPQWYVSSGDFPSFSPGSFSDSIQSATSTLTSAMFSAPRGSGLGSGGDGGGSSGGGDGGSSGGGFGGGGGGDW